MGTRQTPMDDGITYAIADDIVLRMRGVAREDINQLYELAAKEGWALSLPDIGVIHDTHPKDFYGAFEENGQLAGVCACFLLDSQSAILGYYITRLAYRKQGLGRKLFHAALSPSRVGERTVLLHAAPYLVPTYSNAGFACSGLTFRSAEGIPRRPTGGESLQHLPGNLCITREISEELENLFCEYDHRITLSDSRGFKRKWIFDAENSITCCALANQKPVGLLTIRRPTQTTAPFYLSSFYADDVSVARALVNDVIDALPPGTRLKCYYPSANKVAPALLSEFGVTSTDEGDYAQPMYKGKDIFRLVDWSKVFSITNFTNAYV